MNTKTIILLIILTTATTLAKIPQYEVVDLGSTGGTNEFLLPLSINDHGQVVGNYQYPFGSRAVMFDSTGSANYMLLSEEYSAANAINNYGQIVGYRDRGPSHAMVFGSDGPESGISLDGSGQYRASFASSINDSGLIVGSVADEEKISAAIFDYNNAGSITILPNYIGCSDPYAFSINNLAQIVGVAGNHHLNSRWAGGQSLYESSAFFYDGREMIYLGTLGGDYGIANDINNNGQIIGSAEDAQGLEFATIFDPTGNDNNISLGGLYSKESMATAINDSGIVIGFLLERNSYGGIKAAGDAFYYDGEQMIDLQDCIAAGLDWDIEVAMDINNFNQIIGWGYLDGQQHAFLLNPVTIPEPATLTILAIGTLLTHRRRAGNCRRF